MSRFQDFRVKETANVSTYAIYDPSALARIFEYNERVATEKINKSFSSFVGIKMSSNTGCRKVGYLKAIIEGNHVDGKGEGLFQTGLKTVNLIDYTIHPVSCK